jgi:ATP-dependent RNA helicase DHX8/PRP22
MLQVDINEEEPQFLKGHTARSGQEMSPIRVVKNPDGSMQRAALTQSALTRERRDLQQQRERAELDGGAGGGAKPWNDPLAGKQGDRRVLCGCCLSSLLGRLQQHSACRDIWSMTARLLAGAPIVEAQGSLAPTSSSVCRAGYAAGSSARPQAAFAQPEWKEKALGKATTFGYNDPRPIKEQRASLPIYAFRDDIIRGVQDNRIIILSAETGSGKTTQVTQYLAESGWTAKARAACNTCLSLICC